MDKEEIKIRKGWPNKNDFDPSTKIEKPKTDYKRSSNKSEIQKALEEAEEENQELDFGY
jgi:hypothetical protein